MNKNMKIREVKDDDLGHNLGGEKIKCKMLFFEK